VIEITSERLFAKPDRRAAAKPAADVPRSASGGMVEIDPRYSLFVTAIWRGKRSIVVG
jgi:hypothetical protein